MDCLQCVQSQCPAAMECLMDAQCRDGATCIFTKCLGGGGGFDLQCALGCFVSNPSGGMKAIQALQCVATTCQSCGSMLGGGGLPGFPGG